MRVSLALFDVDGVGMDAVEAESEDLAFYVNRLFVQAGCALPERPDVIADRLRDARKYRDVRHVVFADGRRLEMVGWPG